MGTTFVGRSRWASTHQHASPYRHYLLCCNWVVPLQVGGTALYRNRQRSMSVAMPRGCRVSMAVRSRSTPPSGRCSDPPAEGPGRVVSAGHTPFPRRTGRPGSSAVGVNELQLRQASPDIHQRGVTHDASTHSHRSMWLWPLADRTETQTWASQRPSATRNHECKSPDMVASSWMPPARTRSGRPSARVKPAEPGSTREVSTWTAAGVGSVRRIGASGNGSVQSSRPGALTGRPGARPAQCGWWSIQLVRSDRRQRWWRGAAAGLGRWPRRRGRCR